MSSQVTLIDARTAGISGDMLLAALLDAGADIGIVERTIKLIPKYFSRCESIQLERDEVKTHGFRACKVHFKILEHEHSVEGEAFSNAVLAIGKASRISERAVAFALNSANTLVTAESKVHGVNVSETHLHEAGSTDTLADFLGVAAACDSLHVFDSFVYATPVAVGGGVVSFSHGTLSNPPPATLEIAKCRTIPLVGGSDSVELTTPTGITMLANLAQEFTSTCPAMVPLKVGYGAGERVLAGGPNFLRIVVGQHSTGSSSSMIEILETNLDDVSGEIVSYALQRILDSGARDAWISLAQFKKNRPGYVLHVICDAEDTAKLTKIVMEETGTLGVRHQTWNRLTLDREVRTVNVEVEGRKFEVRVKYAWDSEGKALKIKPEADDVYAIAKTLALPAREVSRILEAQIR